MKKLIALFAIGSMFIFVSVQCALTNSHQSYSTTIQAKNAVVGAKHKLEENELYSDKTSVYTNTKREILPSESKISD